MEFTAEAGAGHMPAIEDAKPLSLAAKLYCSDGRRQVTLVHVVGGKIVCSAENPPEPASIVVISRNGIRETAAVTRVDGLNFELALDTALHSYKQEQLVAKRTSGARRLKPAVPTLLAA